MANRDHARPKFGLWRVIVILTAAAMGLAAVCLVVFGTTQKQLQVGVLLGLWGGLTAAFLTFGSRRGQGEQGDRLAEAESRAHQLYEAQLQVSQLQRAQIEAAAQQSQVSQQVELRRIGEVELSREVAARREADFNLEMSLRREIERLMGEHIGALRTEVAALRAEVVDKLGGQLRLERIETTRVIGSDLEALQHEIRRLASNHQDDPASTRPAPLPQESRPPRVDSQVAGTAPWRVEQPADIVDAEVIEAGHASHDEVKPAVHRSEGQSPPFRPEPIWSPPTVVGSNLRPPAPHVTSPAAPPVAEDVPARWQESAAPAPAQPSAPVPVPAQAAPAPARPAEPGPFSSSDPFAGLPRLSPLPPDIELIQDVEPAPPPPSPAGSGPDAEPRAGEPGPAGRRRAPDEDSDDARYHGRRRAEAGSGWPPAAGEPARPVAEQPVAERRADSGAAPRQDGTGRRRAPEDDLAGLPER